MVPGRHGAPPFAVVRVPLSGHCSSLLAPEYKTSVQCRPSCDGVDHRTSVDGVIIPRPPRVAPDGTDTRRRRCDRGDTRLRHYRRPGRPATVTGAVGRSRHQGGRVGARGRGAVRAGRQRRVADDSGRQSGRDAACRRGRSLSVRRPYRRVLGHPRRVDRGLRGNGCRE